MKKIISMAMVIVMLLSISTVYAFTDMPTDQKSATAMENAVKNGLLNGVSETSIAPNDSLTRAQMAAIITRCLGVTKTADVSAFPDLVKTEWYYDSIQKAVAIGALNGSDGKMLPDTEITVEQAFTVVARVFDLQYKKDDASNGFADASKISDWAKDSINKIVFGGYWEATGNLNPQKPITRAEFAILMDNMVKEYITQPGTYNTLPNGNVVIKCEGVTISSASTTGDIYIADAVTGTTVVENTTAERVVIRGGSCKVSGTFGWVRAVEDNTKIILGNVQIKETKDGSKGKIYSDKTKTNCKIDLGKIKL